MLLFGVLIGYYGMRTERRSRSIAERNPTHPGAE
jgi:hypothetical protein